MVAVETVEEDDTTAVEESGTVDISPETAAVELEGSGGDGGASCSVTVAVVDTVTAAAEVVVFIELVFPSPLRGPILPRIRPFFFLGGTEVVVIADTDDDSGTDTSVPSAVPVVTPVELSGGTVGLFTDNDTADVIGLVGGSGGRIFPIIFGNIWIGTFGYMDKGKFAV